MATECVYGGHDLSYLYHLGMPLPQDACGTCMSPPTECRWNLYGPAVCVCAFGCKPTLPQIPLELVWTCFVCVCVCVPSDVS